jgi:Raf kinase inhibitor-like YbhB/YbcL family protein
MGVATVWTQGSIKRGPIRQTSWESPMKTAVIAVVGLVASALTLPAQAAVQTAPPPFQGPALAQDRVLSPAVESVDVASSAFKPGEAIALVYSGYGKSLSFPVSWTAGPAGTQSYALFVEDPDSGQPQPTLHWLAYNIPSTTLSLSKGVHNSAVLKGAKTMMQGINSKGGIGYVGPHPAVGDAPHHYHVQVFALSRMLPLGGGATRDQVLEAMHDRILAEGELIGTFAAPTPPPAPAQ